MTRVKEDIQSVKDILGGNFCHLELKQKISKLITFHNFNSYLLRNKRSRWLQTFQKT